MPQHAWSHGITASAGRAHRGQELRVNEEYLARILQVVPVPMIEILAEQLDWRLSSVYLPRRHVHVIDENDRLLVWWRSEVTFLPAIHLCHYQKLHVQYIRLCKNTAKTV